MSWLKQGCIVGVAFMAAGLALAQTADTTPLLIDEFARDARTADGATPERIAEYRIGEPATAGQRSVTAGAVYSDITTFSGNAATPPGGAPSMGMTRATKLLADDIQCVPGAGGAKLTGFTFSVANLNTSAVSCVALVRFYADNANTPGTYLYGVNFTCTSFAANSVGLYAYAIPAASQPTIPADGKLWVGIAFMRIMGCMSASTTQLNNMSVGLYTPVDVGTSLDEDFLSTSNGGTDQNNVFKADSPAGSVRTTPYTSAAARHGYELASAVGACCYANYTCEVTAEAACTGTWLGADVPCTQCPPPPSPTGACCYANYTCEVTAEAACTGTWLGVDVPCTQCPPPPDTGACCTAFVCSIMTEAQCLAGSGHWKGPATVCAGDTCACRGDTNGDGVISFADINPFVQALGNLSAWQAEYPTCAWQNCDVNADGVVSFADINPFVALLGTPGPCP